MRDFVLLFAGPVFVMLGAAAMYFYTKLRAPEPQVITKSVGRLWTVVSTTGDIRYDGDDGRLARIALESVKGNLEGKQWFLLEDGMPRTSVG